MVTFSNVLKTHGLEPIIPYAFACSALAAFISPLYRLPADEHISPTSALAGHRHCGFWLWRFSRSSGAGHDVGADLFQLQALSAPPGGEHRIGLSAWSNPAREFGPVRVWATFGGWPRSITSYLLQADDSPRPPRREPRPLGVAALAIC
jgi:hypothetical protein